MTSLKSPRLLAAVGVLLTCGVLHASSAGFEFTALGVDLGKADQSGEVWKYKIKVSVGQTVTLVAQGMVAPRGAAPSPSEAEAAKWTFDDAALKLMPHEKAKFDKTKTVIALQPLKAGTTRVRFAGKILGYERQADITIEAVEKK